MLSSLAFGLFSTVTVIGCTSVTLKLYWTMPPTLTSVLGCVFDFTFALTEVTLKLAYILLLFISNIAVYVLGIVLKLVPVLYKVTSSVCSILVWIASQIVLGVFGLGDKTTNTLSWLIVFCSVFFYVDRKYYSIRYNRTPDTDNDANTPERNNANTPEGDNANNENIIRRNHNGNDTDMVSDDDDDGNQQLEWENRENENEANSLEEVDRTRMQDDNERNIEREMQQGGQDDRHDHEFDITLCVICFERERNVAVFPCGHTHLCLQCVRQIRQRNGLCPMCQRHIQEYRQIYV